MKQIKTITSALFFAITCCSSTIFGQTVIGTGTTGYLTKFTAASTIANSIIFENASANVGIGTTPLTGEFVSFQKNQTLETRIGLRNLSNGAGFASFNVQSLAAMINIAAYHSSYTTGTGMVQANTGVLSATGNLNIGTTSSSLPLSFWTNGLKRMTVISTGNVGIGTATPDKLFTVVSPVENKQIAKFADDMRYIGLGRDEVAAFDLAGNPANLYLGGAKLNILTNGNVGIGTSTPESKLEVAGQIKITGGIPGVNKVLTSDASGLASWTTINGLLSGGTTNYITKWTNANTLSTSSKIYDDGTNVGIGTATPDKLFTVVSPVENKQIAKFADDMRYIGLGRDEVAAFDLAGNPANLYLGGTKLNILTNGNIGIGTTTPYKKLTVNGDASFGSTNGMSGLEILGNGQIPLTRGISVDNDPSGKFNFYVHSSQTNAGFYFKNALDNSTLVSIYGNGNVRIGATNPLAPHDNALLAISGKVVCQSLYVLKTTSWADFVFKKNDLEKLENVEKFINENKHLPGIPSEEEVLKNGYDINEMDAKLLEKIETLYLHIIALEKEVKTLKSK